MPSLDFDGLDLHYDTRGNPETPPVVLLHDAGADGRAWHPVAVALAPDFHVITLDLPGHGQSGFVEDAQPTLATYTGALGALLDILGLELAAVAGHGFGGIVALQFAVEHPERVVGLVLSDTTPAHDYPGYDDAIRAHEAHLAALAEEAMTYGAAIVGKRASLSVTDPFMATGLRSLYAGLRPPAYAAAIAARAARPDVLPLMAGRLAAVPVLITHGEGGPFAVPSDMMARELSSARLVAFRDEPLEIPIALPEAFARQVLTFFDLLERGQPIAARLKV
ncbi:MAG: alpha/beta fold hydrolase [Tepidiformaceae bacterium]